MYAVKDWLLNIIDIIVATFIVGKIESVYYYLNISQHLLAGIHVHDGGKIKAFQRSRLHRGIICREDRAEHDWADRSSLSWPRRRALRLMESRHWLRNVSSHWLGRKIRRGNALGRHGSHWRWGRIRLLLVDDGRRRHRPKIDLNLWLKQKKLVPSNWCFSFGTFQIPLWMFRT